MLNFPQLTPWLDGVPTPALLIDTDAVAHNIEAMVRGRLEGHADRWRPHVKTLKQSALVEQLLERGVRRFKCATIRELVLVLDTADSQTAPSSVDVLWAYPPHVASLGAFLRVRRRRTPGRGHRLRLLADGPEHLDWLEAQLEPHLQTPDELDPTTSAMPVEVVLDVDLGMGRTGQIPQAWMAAADRLASGRRHLRVTGLSGYDGHWRWDQRSQAHAAYDELVELGTSLRTAAGADEGAPWQLITSGTHSFEHALTCPTLQPAALAPLGLQHEISPGTIVLNDLRSQPAAEALGLRQAAAVLTRVISTAPGRITVDAGSKAISPDVPLPHCAVMGHPELEPVSVSEEHLVLRVGAMRDGGQGLPRLGDVLCLVPAHVCTTVNLHRHAILLCEGQPRAISSIKAAGHGQDLPLIPDAPPPKAT